jgi:ribosomal subunit interface protein
MKVTIFGNTDSSAALQNFVEEKLQKEVGKYFESALNADVYFKKDHHKEIRNFHVTIVINEGTKTGITIKADANSDDPHLSFDMALAKITKQLRRYKDRLKDYARHNRDKEVAKFIEAQKYVLPSYSEEKEGSKQEELNIIEENETKVEELTVEEAIMRMNLANLPALMFTNKDNGRINIVYHRKDGNISWVDPKSKK